MIIAPPLDTPAVPSAPGAAASGRLGPRGPGVDPSAPLKIRLHGFPIAYSASPIFQNTCFEQDGWAWRYELFSTSKVTADVLAWLQGNESAGAAFTMPLKAEIIPFLDGVTPESDLTGAVNTVVKVRKDGEAGFKLIGTNTDFIGIRASLLSAALSQTATSAGDTDGPSPTRFAPGQHSAVVVGGGATTRSAVLALWTLGIGTVFLVNRDAAETEAIVQWFESKGVVADGLRLMPLPNVEAVESRLEEDGVPPLALGVGAIPSILPTTPEERRVYSTTSHLLSFSSARHLALAPHPQHPSAPSPSNTAPTRTIPALSQPIFLDMAYHPRQTHLLSLAGALGWRTISGDNAMIEQGYAQQRMWRLGDASALAGAKAGVLGRETEREARRVIEQLGDVHVHEVEVDRAAKGL